MISLYFVSRCAEAFKFWQLIRSRKKTSIESFTASRQDEDSNSQIISAEITRIGPLQPIVLTVVQIIYICLIYLLTDCIYT